MISIIDDDDVVREAVGILVESLGYATATFSSANDYLKSSCLAETSCVITDLNMPGMSGLDLQERLISDGYRTPVIFMTAYFDETVRARALDAGALGFLRKPFDDKALIACLEKLPST